MQFKIVQMQTLTYGVMELQKDGTYALIMSGLPDMNTAKLAVAGRTVMGEYDMHGNLLVGYGTSPSIGKGTSNATGSSSTATGLKGNVTLT